MRRSAARLFVTPLGNSLPTCGQQLGRPVARPAAQFRTIPLRCGTGVRRRAAFYHEPLAPRADGTSLLLKPTPAFVGTVLRCWLQPAYTAMRPLVRWGAINLDPARRGVGTPATSPGPPRRRLVAHVPAGWRFGFASAEPWPPTPDGAVRRTTRAPKGPRRPAEGALEGAARRGARIWVAGTGPDTDALQPATDSESASVARSHRRPRSGTAELAGSRRVGCPVARRGVPSASSCSRPWQPGRQWWPATSQLHQGRRRPGAR